MAFVVSSALLVALTLVQSHGDRPRRATVRIELRADGSETVTACGEPRTQADLPDGLVQEATQRARNLLSSYAIRLTTDPRPAHLPQSRLWFVVPNTGTPDTPGPTCVESCVDFVEGHAIYVHATPTDDAGRLGRRIAHQIAHAWGLEHIDANQALMAPGPLDGDAAFARACTPLTATAVCTEQHEEHCDPGQQNSYVELLHITGPDSEDTTPPWIEILSPADGDRFEPSEPIPFSANVWDDFEGHGWKFSVEETGWEHIAGPNEFGVELDGLEPGRYTLRVDAIDHDLNQGVATVQIQIPREDSGCSCRFGTAPSRWIWLLLLPTLRPRNRRRSSAGRGLLLVARESAKLRQ